MKITLIGAGSAQFGFGTLGDIFQSKPLQGAEINLLDINQKALDFVYKRGQEFIDKHKLDFTLSATLDRKEALRGADFVIISIEVGNRFELWKQDWKYPLQFGINQVYGENGGPGGLFHALRITPPIIAICDDVMQVCPEAYVFCYSNPMTSICTTVKRKYPELNFIGMCHEIASIEEYVPRMLNIKKDNLQYRAAGLNHFSILLEASYRNSGKDAYPDIRAKTAEFFSKEPGYSEMWKYARKSGHHFDTEGFKKDSKAGTLTDVRAWSDRTLFKTLFERFGYLPITSDSHLGEYIAWAQDAADHQGILDFFAMYEDFLSRVEEHEIKMEQHERCVSIMEGVIADSGYEEFAVNILNNGCIPSLPNDIVVEVPAIVNKQGLKGIEFPDYPRGFGALLRAYSGAYDITAEAILSGKKSDVIQALLVNPVVNKVKDIEQLVDLMINNQSPWLDYIK